MRFALPWLANGGIGLPFVTHDGHLRCAIWKKMPSFASQGAANLLALATFLEASKGPK